MNSNSAVYNFYGWYVAALERLKDLPPLIFRLILAYGFYEPALMKIRYPEGQIKFFTGLGIPFPEINYYMATGTEALGVVLLILGLGIRFITIPLMVVMIVAIATVHWEWGFAACQCSHPSGSARYGYELPFYFFWMLFFLLVNGAGRLSLDYLLGRKRATTKP
jgi:putative oxidoreductase